MANKPQHESKKPVSDADLKRAVAGQDPKETSSPKVASSTAPATHAGAAASKKEGFASYTVPAHLGSATVTGPKGTQVLAGGETAVFSHEDAKRIGATAEGEPAAKRPDGALDAHGSTRAEQLPHPVKDEEE